MKLESFENEIARLESQLQEAIGTLRILKDVQATFQDMQPRYERLKQLTDEAAGLPDYYAKQFETARQHAEARLTGLEAQAQQQQTDWQTTVTQHQQVHHQSQQRIDRSLTDLQQRLESHKSTLEALAIQHQQDQATLEESFTQSTTELQNAITALGVQITLVNTNLLAFMRKALEDQAEQLREEWTHQFQKALYIGLLGGAIALGTLAVVLFR